MVPPVATIATCGRSAEAIPPTIVNVSAPPASISRTERRLMDCMALPPPADVLARLRAAGLRHVLRLQQRRDLLFTEQSFLQHDIDDAAPGLQRRLGHSAAHLVAEDR